jgi:UPF0755 protein
MFSFISKTLKSIIFAVCIALVFLIFFYFFQYRAPHDFPTNAVVSVTNGKGVTKISQELQAKHIIRSPFWLINFIIVLRHHRQIVGGEYYFSKPENVFHVAERLAKGDFQVEQIKTTVPEGVTAFDISDILLKNYPTFDASHFIMLAKNKEGYLFPDTYKFGSSVLPEKVIEVMTSNFAKKIADKNVQNSIHLFGKPLDQVLVMASILEGEARQMHTRQLVAGILWNRIRLGIPLQVDAAFRYVNGKTTAALTKDDLKIDSPYNTYIHTGLPPTPISNPGLESILAAVTPIQTDYIYFLTDKNGTMHYAKTLDEHAMNVNKYLK